MFQTTTGPLLRTHHLSLVCIIVVACCCILLLSVSERTCNAFQPVTTTTTTSRSSSSSNIYTSTIIHNTRRQQQKQQYQVRLLSTTNNNNSNQDNSENDDNDTTLFMKSLSARMAQIQRQDTQLPIVVLDTMLPRQRLKIEVTNTAFKALVRHCIESERPRFGMIGMVATTTTTNNSNNNDGPTNTPSNMMPLQNGVEVELVGQPIVVNVQDENDGDKEETTKQQQALRVELVGGRRFRIIADTLSTNPTGGWTEAKVQFLKAQEEDLRTDSTEDVALSTTTIGTTTNTDNKNNDNDNSIITEQEDPTSLASAMKLAAELTNGDDNLVDQWIALARTKEHFPGQIDQLLRDLGDIPPFTMPSDRAMWIGALINPLPGMGVSMEIRPQLLMARTADERIGVVYSAIEASIAHMDGSKPLF